MYLCVPVPDRGRSRKNYCSVSLKKIDVETFKYIHKYIQTAQPVVRLDGLAPARPIIDFSLPLLTDASNTTSNDGTTCSVFVHLLLYNK